MRMKIDERLLKFIIKYFNFICNFCWVISKLNLEFIIKD